MRTSLGYIAIAVATGHHLRHSHRYEHVCPRCDGTGKVRGSRKRPRYSRIAPVRLPKNR